MSASTIQSKISEVVTKSTLVYETENHLFKIMNAELNADGSLKQRARGVIEHKNGQHCGEFAIHNMGRKMLSINLNLDCKDLLVDFVSFLNQLNNKNVVEVENFNYETQPEPATAE